MHIEVNAMKCNMFYDKVMSLPDNGKVSQDRLSAFHRKHLPKFSPDSYQASLSHKRFTYNALNIHIWYTIY